ncbi:hypothetical protein [Aromatoleum sp.]|uniref:hypothetical protein n=1 Tax=Aromatoleum sp. TaxID=2307007 RepID=UPI002FCB3FC8
MKKIVGAALAVLFAANVSYALAQATPATPAGSAAGCEARAVDRNGKPLAGAALASFMKKCEAEAERRGACDAKAVGKDGKPLSGAAKTSFMKKCEAGR